MSGRFDGQAAIVTGAGSGIGRETALRLARDGADVIAVDRDSAGAKETVRRGNGPGRIAALGADVTDDEAPARIVAVCEDRFGAPRILVNNAGIGDARAAHLTEDPALDGYLDVNLRALFRLSRDGVAAMMAGGGGVIVNIASVFGVTGFRGSSAYSATKAAVIGLTRNMAADYGPHGIRVNAVAPGIVETPLTRDRIANNRWFADAMIGGTPLGRAAAPEEIAAAIAFLCSADASFINGHVLAVDGGFSATHFRPLPGDGSST